MTETAPATPHTPALEPLLATIATLRRGGVEVALGGSGLLASLGLTDHVGDWDVTTDSSVDEAEAALGDTPHEWFGNSGIHADHKLVVDGGTIEVICRFALRSDAGVCRVPTVVTGTWRGVPVGSPVAWAVAYALLGREPREEARLPLDHDSVEDQQR